MVINNHKSVDSLIKVFLFMKKIQLDRYNMVLAIDSYLQKNAALFVTNLPLAATAVAIREKNSQLQAQIALQLVNFKGTTINKKNHRKALESHAFVLSSACCSYASAIGDADFYDRCHYSRSHFVHFKDIELVGICTLLLQEIKGHVAVLLPYSVTPVMISDFELTVNRFLDIAEKPLEARSKKAEATGQIALLLTEIITIIRIRLDSNMVSMQASHPDFVAVYKNLRRLKNSGATKRSLTVTVIDAVSGNPVPEVILEIAKGIRRKSGPKGMCFVQQLSKGEHQLLATHPEYEPRTLKFSIRPDETTKLQVVLNRFAEV
jgi:hypothetical protein